MARALHLPPTLFEAWKQAEIEVEMAEKRWAAVLHDSDALSAEKLQRRQDLIGARTTARKLFQQIFDAIPPDLQLDWRLTPQPESGKSEENRPDYQ